MNKRQIKPLRFILLIIFVLLVLLAAIAGILTVKDSIEEIEILEEKVISSIVNNTKKDVIYLAKGDSYSLDYSFISNKDNSTKSLQYNSSNPENVYVDINGTLKAIGNGESIITISIDNLKETIKVISTDLILPKNNTVLYTKPYLTCNTYSKEENDLLDEILINRINDAGYGTRAGVVAAARFLLLEFPYRIDYFHENGRVRNSIDGEGRYYHTGLYLNDSRFDNIIGSDNGPACWGCSLFSNPAQVNEDNGLDCSGFVTWALLNGGFDIGDLGAGGYDYNGGTLFHLGDREDVTLDNINKIKAGDLVHNEKANAHIGIVVGVEEDYLYVVQATWADSSIFDKPYGVTITKFTPQEFVDDWNEVMLMDSYYKESGNYSSMW